MHHIAGSFFRDFPEWTCEQMFALAAGVEDYPGFVPWCRRAVVTARSAAGWEVDNHFGVGPIDIRFRSHAVPAPPRRLEITSADGPFQAFALQWSFTPRDEGGCRVQADYSVAFRSPLLQGLARIAVPEVEARVWRSFDARARMLYGT
ncbi:MAG: type II toxin-antitoxin system RatA family toxin [Magnetospirillum sp.]|nr:type II toxin-antitoxin system RatA family toxin [Magnetospirillum sp.]